MLAAHKSPKNQNRSKMGQNRSWGLTENRSKMQDFVLFRPIYQGGPGSVRFGYSSCMGRFEGIRFSVLTVTFRVSGDGLLTKRGGSGSGFGS